MPENLLHYFIGKSLLLEGQTVGLRMVGRKNRRHDSATRTCAILLNFIPPIKLNK